jgi:DNA-binding CsgD family transcriptional regulator
VQRLDEPGLTRRQIEVLRLVVRGLANKEIAADLGVTQRAVEATLTRLYERLSVTNRAALIALAMSDERFGRTIFKPAPTRSPIAARSAPRALLHEAQAYRDAPFMVAVTEGPAHLFTFVNGVAAAVAGRPMESLVGRTMREAYPDLDPHFAAVLDGCYGDGRPWSSPGPSAVRWSHEDGSTRDAMVNLIFQPLRDVSGVVAGLLHIGAEVHPPDQ